MKPGRTAGPRWTRPHLPFSLLLLALATWMPAAHAEPKDDARRHFLAGLEAAQAKQFQLALDEFLAAQAVYEHPATLYNIARSYNDLGDLPHALEYFQLYRAVAPDKAADIDPVIAVLTAKLERQREPAVVVAAAAPVADSTPAAVDFQEVERLSAIAKELEALSKTITERAAARAANPTVADATPATVGFADGTPTSGTPTAETPTADTGPVILPDQGEFLSEAYERVVVTASRYGQSPLDSPSTVTILTEQDIRLSGASTVPDVLRRVAGLDVMFLSAGQGDLSIRGFNREFSNKVLVLVDGRSVYLDFLGIVSWAVLGIGLEEIERIEVIRGPGSAIYGANAMTGVVNIITKVPGEGESLVHVEGGSPSYVRGTAVVDGRKERTSWRMSAGWDQTGRWSEGTPIEEGGSLVPFFEDDQTHAWKGARADARIDQGFLEKGLASVSAGYVRGTNEFYALGALGAYAMDYSGGFARGDLAYGPVHLRTFYNGLSGATGPWTSYAGQRDSLNTTFDSDTVDVELETNVAFKTGPVAHRLNAGLGYRYKSIDWGYINLGEPLFEHHFSAFLQDQAKVGPLALVGSLRADRTPLVPIEQTFSPRGAAILRVADRTSVRVTGGTSYRSPTFLESYMDLAQPSSVDGVYVSTKGDPELLPERILTGEIGIHDESTAFHVADAAAYVNRVTDLIGLRDVTPGYSPYDPELNGFSAGETGFVNLEPTYLAFGGEVEARVFPLDGLDVYANVAVERILEQDGAEVAPDESTSLLKVNGGVMYRSPWRIDVGAHVNYVSPQVWRLREFDATGQVVPRDVAVPARTILTARVAVRPFEDDKIEVAASAWNLGALAGNTFREHPNGQLIGARYWGELTWRY
ncbi:MAG: TonB-dependent receptor [Pseudomonadota bacterium]|nr:TonB-dependent receptor [Pseudomonadota bacterium]